MSEYRFDGYSTSAFPVDPVFKSRDVHIYGNAGAYNAPILFIVDKYRYVLSRPYDMRDDAELIYKIAKYLFRHPTSINGTPITYFFGDINLCKEISKDFTNQIKKVVSVEMIDAWFPRNINDINKKVVASFFEKTSGKNKRQKQASTKRNSENIWSSMAAATYTF